MQGWIWFGIYVLVLTLILFIVRTMVSFQWFGRISFIALLRTRFGIRAMTVLARNYACFLQPIRKVCIAVGFIGMAVVVFDIVYGFYKIVKGIPAVTAGLVLPFDVSGAIYVPFWYWIISVVFVMLVHEFSHGVFARIEKIRVKSSGFVVIGLILPLIPGAFVDVDEKALRKKKLTAQLSVFSAGPFANIVFAFAFLLVLFIFNGLMGVLYLHSGVVISDVVEHSPAHSWGLRVGDEIARIDEQFIVTTDDFTQAFTGKRAGSRMIIETNEGIVQVKLGKNQENGQAYLGVFVEQKLQPAFHFLSFLTAPLLWVKELFFWLFALNLGVGAFNLLPLGPLDGGRMFHAVLCRYFRHNHARTVLRGVSGFFCVVLVVSIVSSFL